MILCTAADALSSPVYSAWTRFGRTTKRGGEEDLRLVRFFSLSFLRWFLHSSHWNTQSTHTTLVPLKLLAGNPFPFFHTQKHGGASAASEHSPLRFDARRGHAIPLKEKTTFIYLLADRLQLCKFEEHSAVNCCCCCCWGQMLIN